MLERLIVRGLFLLFGVLFVVLAHSALAIPESLDSWRYFAGGAFFGIGSNMIFAAILTKL